MVGLRSLLSNRGLRRLLAAQTPADFADWLDFVAISALLAFRWHVEPFVFAMLGVAFGLPYLVVGPVAGALIDRIDLRHALIGSNLARAAATMAMSLAVGWPSLLALVFLRGIADCFFTPAKQGALQALTTSEERTAANGLSHAINQAAKIAAPSIGGVLLLVMEPTNIFLVNALVSLSAAAILWRLPGLDRAAASEPGPQGLLARTREGFRLLSGKPLLSGVLLLMAAGYFGVFFYDTLIAPLIRDFGLSETALGLCMAAVGAGGVLGAIMLGVMPSPRRPLVWMAAAYGVSALLIGWLGIIEIAGRGISLPAICAIFVTIGVAFAVSQVVARTLIQDEVPPEHIGRVTALSEAAIATAMLTAPFLGAALASALSVGAAFVAGGALMAAAGGFALLLHKSRGQH